MSCFRFQSSCYYLLIWGVYHSVQNNRLDPSGCHSLFIIIIIFFCVCEVTQKLEKETPFFGMACDRNAILLNVIASTAL